MSKTGNISARAEAVSKTAGSSEAQRQQALLKTGALQNAILTSPNFSIIATNEPDDSVLDRLALAIAKCEGKYGYCIAACPPNWQWRMLDATSRARLRLAANNRKRISW